MWYKIGLSIRIVQVIISFIILRWVRTKIRLIKDPEVSQYYNLITVRIYQAIFAVNIVRITKGTLQFLYFTIQLTEYAKTGCPNHEV